MGQGEGQDERDENPSFLLFTPEFFPYNRGRVRYLFQTLKKLLFWAYGRSTWQYDVLCALILAFIFLTPQSWLRTSELKQAEAHPNPSARAYLLVEPGITPEQIDRAELERRVRTMTGRPEITVTNWRPVRDEQGRIVGFEVDIR